MVRVRYLEIQSRTVVLASSVGILVLALGPRSVIISLLFKKSPKDLTPEDRASPTKGAKEASVDKIVAVVLFESICTWPLSMTWAVTWRSKLVRGRCIE